MWQMAMLKSRQPTSMQNSTILCIDDDLHIRDLITAALELDGYRVLMAPDGAQGLQAATAEQPQLIILDVMLPDMRGWDVLRALKQHPRTANIPVIFLSALDDPDDRVIGLGLGADDYVGKPFAIKELLARVRTQLRHAEEHLLSELTSLPGNTQIQRVLRQALKDPRRDLYVLYIDMDNFKSYNDAYGFLRGNELIKLTASILREVITDGDSESFVGHIGGDDFVAVVRKAESGIGPLCDAIIARFDEQVPLLYDPEDREQGYVVATDRQNIQHRFPIVTISIAVVTNRRREIPDEWDASAIAAQLKKQAKQAGCSSYFIDQRAGP
jgi:DNA-binding response OmpR family regulator